jgi:hypothetical protein
LFLPAIPITILVGKPFFGSTFKVGKQFEELVRKEEKSKEMGRN